ncbi:hypothetical protein DE146DRAFT_184695 [Phaeosphaeria sp. MPI-PUGE-AT-0046c]|nr:hypothetical protein DE146DRAFT_184695 [Phaeosphaeria sp. MPI-PUGE-AT-0046c]
MSVPNVGDILMLSQLCWKLGRAFCAGQKSSPIAFQEVETGISRLAKALKQLAEVLHTEGDKRLIRDAAEHTQYGIEIILDSCKRTINDLDSLVEHNQVIKKHRTVGGFAIERSWSDLVLAEYETMVWTTEGGNLRSLQDLLRMHTSCITLLVQAVQSNSHSRLESVVSPMADRIDTIAHGDGSLDQQMDEVYRMVQDLIIAIPTEPSPPIPVKSLARSPQIEKTDPMAPMMKPESSLATSPRRVHTRVSLPQSPQRPKSPEEPTSPKRSSSVRTPVSPTETTSTFRATSPTQKRISEFSFGGSSLRYSSSSYASSTASSGAWSSPATPLISYQSTTTSMKQSQLPGTPEVWEPIERGGDEALSLLPPPALGHMSQYEHERPTSRSTLSPFPPAQSDLVKLHRSSTTSSQKAAFEKEAFRNSAVLCDVRGQLSEYSHRINEDDPRDVEMIRVCDECRIAVVRKRVHDPETRAVRVVTSVWIFSDDNAIRMELKMDDTQMYIPYSSYFSPTKVSITVPCELKFHDVKHGNRPAKIANTSWVNYVFETPQDAALFQNELMGRTLLATFRTEKTMRIHEGLGKSFTYAEQMCALENLRVWEDTDSGAIIALIHFSAEFRNGYLAFYLNSSVNPIKVKDDGNREVKIKGLRVPIDKGDKAMRKDSMVASNTKDKSKTKEDSKNVISGAKIEFASDMEKREFMAMVKEMQKDMIELPDLLGVN